MLDTPSPPAIWSISLDGGPPQPSLCFLTETGAKDAARRVMADSGQNAEAIPLFTTALDWSSDLTAAPQKLPFLVRSTTVPSGPHFGEWTYAIAMRGTGTRPGIWADNHFWPLRANPSELGADHWQEWAPLPGVA